MGQIDRLAFLVMCLDKYLGMGVDPGHALLAAAEEYAATYHSKSGLPIAFPNENETEGQLLAQMRKKADLTQADLVKKAGVSHSMISGIEGNYRRPSRTMIYRLCKGMACTSADRDSLLKTYGYFPVAGGEKRYVG